MTQQRSGPPPIVFILIFLLLAGGGYWWFFQRQPAPSGVATAPGQPTGNVPPQQAPNAAPQPVGTAPPPPPAANTFSPPTNVPSGTTVTIDGSTSMVSINESLKTAFQQQFPGTTVSTSANGTENGLQALSNGQADIAAISRPLTPQEQNQGLAAIPVANDAIALVVGVGNPFGQGLSRQQAVSIFTGQISNWSQIGGPDKPIRVINRPPESGTRQAFQELVLGGGNFGNTPNITTMERDATTPMLREVGDDGIGYATAAQILNQSTVRVVAIDGLTPAASQYPYQRILYYVYRNPPTPEVSAFLGFVGSPSGQQAILTAGS
ncbi:substrate-binding domain-containing protein [Baaleninema sp.]|uniref:phosphate ABC transporter substrate-binding protein n=1 Tax=Baaleninema sp. TaxID=3101197 RepID=UPI003D04550F